MGVGLLTQLAPIITEKSRYELEFEFERVGVSLQDTILIPNDRDKPLEDMDIRDFGLVRYSDLFPLGYAGLVPMRFLQRWDDGTMYLKNWAYGDEIERITMEDIYTVLANLDAVVARAPMTREEHALAMGDMTTMRDFVSSVAEQERKISEDKEAEKEIAAGKEEIGIKKK